MITQEHIREEFERKLQTFEDRFDQKLDKLDAKWSDKFAALETNMNARFDEFARIIERSFDEVLDRMATKADIARFEAKLDKHEQVLYKDHEARIKNLESKL